MSDRPTVVASVSGGKDSTALCLHLREMGIPYRAVFADTGWESAQTYRYVREELPGIVGPVEWVTAQIEPRDERDAAAISEIEDILGHHSAMVRLCIRKGMFPSRVIRFCTEELKVKPLLSHMRDVIGGQVVNAVGIRAEESRARSKLPEWEFEKWAKLLQWRPLLAWTFDDVIAIHQRHGVRPNQHYIDGASRVGCWPCIYARKAELRMLADTDPARVEVIRLLERHVTERAAERYAARGEVLTNAPSMFQSRQNPQDHDGEKHDGKCWPIDDVLTWARTAHGGRQFEMFAPDPSEAGCLRWGFCEAKPDAPEVVAVPPEAA